MKKILAVSGGIDSMVMLHMFRDDPDVVVAHFDHGIRSNSSDDCLFVERIAKGYGRNFYSKHAKLGEECSEERARKERYAFLFGLAAELGGEVYTAHHADDAVESAFINILRGTGWRGLAPMSNEDIQRPLIKMSKKDIYRYAAGNGIAFRQDQTNTDDRYLRNRIRRALLDFSGEAGAAVYKLVEKQWTIKAEIDRILAEVEKSPQYSRLLFDCDKNVAIEILRHILKLEGISQTRPQLVNMLVAIKTFEPGKKYSISKEYFLEIKRYYIRITPVKIDTNR